MVNRAFRPAGPDRLWVAGINQHPTDEGFVYLAVLVDAFSNMVVGHSITDHLRSELVVDALERSFGDASRHVVIHHSDHGTQCTSWAFAWRGRATGLAWPPSGTRSTTPSQSFFATLQTELLNRRPRRPRRAELARATFDYIETFHHPVRRPSSCDMLSPADYDRTRRTVRAAAA